VIFFFRREMKTLILVLAFLVMAAGCSILEPEAGAPKIDYVGSIVRLDPAMDRIVPASTTGVEKLAGDFLFIDGPLWRPESKALWFSDVIGNVVRQWSTDGKLAEMLRPGGYNKKDAPAGSFIGPNGMIADKNRAVLLCQHGNRRIVRISKDREVTPYLERFEGKRFNSPNDLVYRSDASLYFTDPPYGLLAQDEDPKKEIRFNGVYRYAKGRLQVVVRNLTRPNGIAFSPDEKTLYVSNSDPERKVWMAYDVAADGGVRNGRVFFDVTRETDDGLPDGMKVDSQGNLYCTGPGGIWVFSPSGKHLGTIKAPETPANCNWDGDRTTLYITAHSGLYRIKLGITGKPALYQ
jgi:gluconolactonase